MKFACILLLAFVIGAFAQADSEGWFGADGLRAYGNYTDDPRYAMTQAVLGSFTGCNVPGVGSGTCQDKTKDGCGGGHYYPGYCPGSNNIQCCAKGGASGGWSRADCMKVANAWLSAGVKYSWSPTTKQYVNSGPGLFRSDCSGLVSAAWNFSPPGFVVNNMPGREITSSMLQPCDALRHIGSGTAGHIALFAGWSGSNPIVIEECGHMSSCCGGQATCPGSCGSGSSCNEYCAGCPIQKRTWSGGLRGFQPWRRAGW